MRAATTALALVAILVLGGCASERSSPSTVAATATPSAGHVSGTPLPLPIPDVAMTPCPGVDWPPQGADAGDAVTINWYDSIIPGAEWVQITNRTSRTVYVFANGGPVDPDEACRSRGNDGSGGPVRAGSTLETTVVDAIRSVGAYVFADPCGEACFQAPIGWMDLPRRPAAPSSPDPSTGAMPPVAMMPCPGTAWPPPGVAAEDALTAVSIDSIRVEATNGTSTTYYLSIADSAIADPAKACAPQGNGCHGARSTPGSTVAMECGVTTGPVGIVVFAEPCGEACRQEPVGWMVLPRSPIAPMATD